MKTLGIAWPKKIVFALFFTTLLILGVEGVLRVRESFWPPEPVDARSLIAGQQLELPRQPVVRARRNGREVVVRWCGENGWFGSVGQALPAVKNPSEYRFVLLGGSAAAGYGVPSTANFLSKAERMLNQANAHRRYTAVNLAHTCWNSAQMVETLRTCAPELQPDLIITVMGNNEYLDLPSFGTTVPEVHRAIVAHWFQRHLAFARLFRRPVSGPKTSTPPAWPSMNRDPRIMHFVEERLRRSIHQLAQYARAHRAKLLVCTVPVNFRYQGGCEWFFARKNGKDSPPEFNLAQWGFLIFDYPAAIAAMERRIAQQPDDAAAYLVEGMAYTRLGNANQARKYLTRAIALADEHQSSGRNSYDETVVRVLAVCDRDGPQACEQTVAPLLSAARSCARPGVETQAMCHWRTGYFLALLGRSAEAKAEFREAINTQSLPAHRADDQINRTLLDAARAEGDVATMDLAAALSEVSPNGILGYEFFFDYCHYTAIGHTAVGALLARRIAELSSVNAAIPTAANAVAEEQQLRRGRQYDLPDIQYWAGADFHAEWLAVERPSFSALNALLAELAKQFGGPHEALAHVYTGNWYVASPRADITGARARAEYEQALRLDPNLTAAQGNLNWLAQYR